MSVVDLFINANISLFLTMAFMGGLYLLCRSFTKTANAQIQILILRVVLITSTLVPFFALAIAKSSGLSVIMLNVYTDFDGMWGASLSWVMSASDYRLFWIVMIICSISFGIIKITLDLLSLRLMQTNMKVVRQVGRFSLCEGPTHIQPCAYMRMNGVSVMLPEGLSAVDRKNIILHELMHIRHHDLLWNWIASLAMCFYAWNPAFWVWRMLHQHQCELASDSMVVEQHQVSPRCYINSLLDLSQKHAPTTFAMGLLFLGTRARRWSNLKHRIEYLLDPREKHIGWRLMPATILFVLLINIGFATTQVTVRPWSLTSLSHHTNANLERMSSRNLSPPYGLVLAY